MSEPYEPGPPDAEIREREGDAWSLVLVRHLRHPPERVWRALVDPAQLREWAPFDADRDLGAPGPVTLATAGMPGASAESRVARADEPRLLEVEWGGNDVRWTLEPTDAGTRLTLWARIDRRYVAMGAAGWHVCLDVLGRLLDGTPIGRLVAGDAARSEGWRRLNRDYSARFGVEEKSPF